MVVPLHGGYCCQLRQLAMELAEAHQLPDPTIVTLCFCSWAPRVAMVFGQVRNESLRCARRGEVRGRVEKRRRNIAAIVATIGEVIGRRVEV